jgi:DNA mismatch repair protein MutS2
LKFFPGSALVQLEYEKVKALLALHCRTEYAKIKTEDLRLHTKKEFIITELQQSHEFKLLLQAGLHFPNEFTYNLSKELKLVSIPGAVLSGEQFLLIRHLADNTNNLFRWFDNERRTAYPALAKVVQDSYYEKMINELIDIFLMKRDRLKTMPVKHWPISGWIYTGKGMNCEKCLTGL